jgi:putative alpha-1,2-mannosidase
MGNEVNMQSAFLFNYSGKPWLTQKYSRAILDSYYGSTPYQGWEGDEDEGQMGGWFVMSAMGMFEMEGGCAEIPMVNLSSPLFEKVTIKLDNTYYKGDEFVIEALNNSKENIYIQSATLNDKPLNSTQIRFKDITEGGRLILKMGPLPNKDWGKNAPVAFLKKTM